MKSQRYLSISNSLHFNILLLHLMKKKVQYKQTKCLFEYIRLAYYKTIKVSNMLFKT